MNTKLILSIASVALGGILTLNAEVAPLVDLVADYAPGADAESQLPGNTVDRSATSLTVEAFRPLVLQAFDNHLGGVGFNYESPIPAGAPAIIFPGAYGEGLSKRFVATADYNMQTVGPGGSFSYVSGQRAITQNNENSSGFTLSLALTDADGFALVGEFISHIGVTVVSRNTGLNYPLDVRVTAHFGDGGSESATTTIGTPRGADDVFFGFFAPVGVSITSLQLEGFEVGTTIPKPGRICIDDLGFVAGTVDPDLAVIAIEKGEANIVLTVDNPSGEPYNVQRTLNLDDSWETVDTNQSGATWSGPVPTGANRAFWRLTR